jgi:sensor histidine kinase YesM
MVVSLVVIVFLRFRYVNMRKEVMISRLEKEANQSRLNFLKSQMNPHFYFNTLNAINSFVLKHEIREANRFLTTFAKLMREILENSQKEFVQISDEKQVLEKYLSLQQLRFPGLFQFEVEVDPSVADKLIPPMFLQPFVENSVEYAFIGKKDQGIIKVVFSNSSEGISCLVQDNGIGIDKSQQIIRNSNHKSTAIRNIRKRIEMLNTIYNLSIRLEIMALDPENKDFPGTVVRLVVPDFDKIIHS